MVKRLVVVAMLVASVTLSACTQTVKDAELSIDVTGLPAGVAAIVSITGPEGTRDFPSSGTWKVKPGDYSLHIGQVNSHARAYLPADETTAFKAEAGQTVSVPAAYRIIIPETTRIAPSDRDSPIVSASPTQVVFKSGQYAARLQPGNVVVSGVGSKVTQAFAARVDSLTTRGSNVVAKVTEVPMMMALPRMVIRVASPEPGSGGTGGGSAADPSSAPQPGPEVELAKFQWFEYPLGKRCKVGTSTALKVGVKGFKYDFHSDVDLEWDWGGVDVKAWPLSVDVELPGPKITVTGTHHFEGNFVTALESPVKFECKIAEWNSASLLPGVSLDKVCKKAVKLLGVGWLLTPDCAIEWRNDVKISASAGVNLGAEVHYEADLKTEVALGKVTLPLAYKARLPLPKVVDKWASFGAPKPQVEAKIEGAYRGGPYTKLGIGIGIGKSVRIGIALVRWDAVGAKIGYAPKIKAEGKISLTGTIDHEIGIAFDFPGEKWDSQPTIQPLPMTFPIAEWNLYSSNDSRHPVPLPSTVPGRIHLPNEKDERAKRSSKRGEPWRAAYCHPSVGVLPSDSKRTAMQTVNTALGDYSDTWQIAVYSNEDSARAAFAELRTASTSCPDRTSTAAKPVELGSEAFWLTTFSSWSDTSGNSELGSSRRVAVVRVGHAIIAVDIFESVAQKRDLDQPVGKLLDDFPALIKILCEEGFSCAA